MLRRFLCLLGTLLFAVALPGFVHAQISYSESTLYEFCSQPECADGDVPYGNLVQGGDGNFYGMVNGPDYGDVYRVTPAGAFTLLHTFTGSATDGGGPFGPLIEGTDGNFYGMTYAGGASDSGTAFRITPDGDFTLLHSFSSSTGAFPMFGALLQASDGNFYGTTGSDGPGGSGVVFKLTPDGTYSVLHSFTGGTDGAAPLYGLVESSDGNLYGTNVNGGAHGHGAVFKITLGGIFTPVYEFCRLAYCNDGAYAQQLIVGSDGNLYGTTLQGGISIGDECPAGCGIIFKVAPSGTFTTLFQFCGANASCPFGHNPQTFLVQANDGNFYGDSGGANGLFFQLTSAGSITAAYTPNCDYSTPCGYLGFVQGMDGNFYGQTTDGGNAQAGSSQTAGTAIKLTPSTALVSSSGAPVQISFSPASVAVGGQTTLSWKVLNGFSQTMQQCYAFVQNSATSAGTWTGLQTGSIEDGSYQGSTTVQPTAAGVYGYALTCGGVETGIGTLVVGSNLPTTMSLVTNSPVTVGGLVTIAATPLTSPSPLPLTGSVALKSGSTALGSLPLVNGTATLNISTNSIPPGTYPLTATYSGNSQFQGSSVTQNVTIAANTTTTDALVSSSAIIRGGSVTLSAIVTRQNGNPAPGGSVAFYVAGVLQATVPVSNGMASFQFTTNSSSPLGTYVVTAKYSGDAADLPSTNPAGAGFMVQVNTTTTVTVSSATVASGQTLTITATVARVGATGNPAGQVQINFVGTGEEWQGNLSGGKFTVSIPNDGSLPVGTFSVDAVYEDDVEDARSTSPEVSVTIDQPGATTGTALSVSPTTLSPGQTVMLSATVTTGGSVPPTGSVTFYADSVALVKAPLNNGAATENLIVPANEPPGKYTLYAYYKGDSNNLPSTSPGVAVTLHNVTTTTLTVSPNPVPANSAVTLTAKVKPASGSAIPTGTVTFTFNGTSAGSATLDGTGTASVNFSTIGVVAGSYSAIASYSGDANNGASTSAPASVTVE